MIEVIASGDHHFKRGDRWLECLRVHSWIAEEVHRRKPALFVSTGDVYDRASTPDERAAVASFLIHVAEVCPVLVVRGNHDRPRDLELLARLHSAFPIIVEEGASVHMIRGFDVLAVGAFAWPSRASIMAALGARSSEEVGQLGREALRRVFRGLGDRLRLDASDGARTLLVGHAHVTAAAVQENGQPLPFGESIAVGLEDLELAGAEAVALGHIHLAQEWDRPDGPIAYTGSPFRNTFGESEPKSILSIKYGATGGAYLERIPTPASPMILVDTPEGLEKILATDPDELAGAEVRIRYDVTPDDREASGAAMRAATDKLSPFVGRLKVEERVRPVTVARSPEIAAASGTLEQLRAYWRGDGVAPSRFAALTAKYAELEEEVRS